MFGVSVVGEDDSELDSCCTVISANGSTSEEVEGDCGGL